MAGCREQVSGGRFQVADGRFQGAGFREQVAGGRLQVAGSRFQRADCRLQMAGGRFQGTGGCSHFKPELGIPFAPGISTVQVYWNRRTVLSYCVPGNNRFYKKSFFYIGSFGISSVLLFSILFEYCF